jgi:hypothetical protein
MTRTLVLCAAALVASMSGSYAGPCSQEIDRLRAEIDAKLGALAAAGPTTQESTAATKHRQPTPRSIAAAEKFVILLSIVGVAARRALQRWADIPAALVKRCSGATAECADYS